MHAFVRHPLRMWVITAFGRNPLIRCSDRIQALITVVAIIATLAAVPIGCSAGTAVYTRDHQQYVREAQTRHAVTATATDTGSTAANSDTVIVQASLPGDEPLRQR